MDRHAGGRSVRQATWVTESGIDAGGLRVRRQALGLSQIALARQLGVTENTVARWERGDMAIGSPWLVRLALDELERARMRQRSNPPFLPVPLLGRHKELAEVRRLLVGEESPVRLLTVIGPAGVGKTWLALAAAQEFAGSFSDGVRIVELAPLHDPATIFPTIARAFGVPEAGPKLLVDRLLTLLADSSVLLVLDNFEHLLDGAPDIAALLSDTSQLQILTTSREPLHVHMEYVFPLAPLALPDTTGRWTKERVLASPAVELFVRSAGAVQGAFELHNANARAVARICTRLDGLPLAIALAAARTRVLSVAAIESRLDHALALLTTGPHDESNRHRSLRAALDWSYQLLDPEEQQVFRHLGIFTGGWMLDAAEAVVPRPVSTESDPSMRIVDRLSRLLEASLVTESMQPDGQPRFALLETIREYAFERLQACGEVPMARRRHAEFFANLADAAAQQFHGPHQVGWLDRLEVEQGNLRSSLRYALHADAELALRLGAALWEFWWMRDHTAEGQRWLRAALQNPVVWSLNRAEALNGAAMLNILLGDRDQAARYLAEGVALCEASGDATALSRLRSHQGIEAWMRGNLDQAEHFLEEALRLARATADVWNAAYAMHHLGTVARAKHDPARATELFRTGLALSREIGDPRATAYFLLSLADLARDARAYSSSLALALQALQQFAALRESWGILWALLGVGLAREELGEFDAAVRLFGAAEWLSEASGLSVSEAVPQWDAAFLTSRNRARAALGSERYAAVLAAGRTMSRQEAIAFALGHLPVRESDDFASPKVLHANAHLSPREQEVAELVAEAHTNREIAERLVVSVRTVEAHLAHICDKLALRSRVEVATWAASSLRPASASPDFLPPTAATDANAATH